MPRGIFIVLEGPNRAGKSTLIRALERRLKSSGCDVLITREPGGTPLGEGLRAVLKDKAAAAGAFATALVFNGVRKEHIDRVIGPALCRGAIVFCDRYYMSTDVFQCILSNELTGVEREIVGQIHKQFIQPDLTVFLLPDVSVINCRAGGMEKDCFEGNPRESESYDNYAGDYGRSHTTMCLRPTLTTSVETLADAIVGHIVIARWLSDLIA